LIELSIVIVIIGFLVGGILVGQSLYRSFQIKSIETLNTKIQTAINTFRVKYDAIPGEFYDYQKFFPQLVGSYCPKYTFDYSPNGFIDDTYEWEAAYAQLQAAGLVVMDQPQILQNGTVRSFWDCLENNMQQKASFYTKFDGITARFAAPASAAGKTTLYYGANLNGFLNSYEARDLDIKFDDGIASSGRIISYNSGSSILSCVTIPNNSPPYNYTTTQTPNNACYIRIELKY